MPASLPGITIAFGICAALSLRMLFVQAVDLLILILAVYLLTDALVNRTLPYGIMTRLRVWLQWDVFMCFYCSSFWSALTVYGMWMLEPRLVMPLAAGGGAVLLWRFTGSNHA